METSVSFDDDASVATIQLLAEGGGHSTASKREIDRLLSSLRPQVRRLADLRSSLQAVMEAVPAQTGEDAPDAQNGPTGQYHLASGGPAIAAASLQGYDDDADDIRMRYGLGAAAATPTQQTQAQNNLSEGSGSPKRDPLDIRRKLERLKLSQISRRAVGGAALRAEMGLGSPGGQGATAAASAPPNARQAAAWMQEEESEDEKAAAPQQVHPDEGRKLVI